MALRHFHFKRKGIEDELDPLLTCNIKITSTEDLVSPFEYAVDPGKVGLIEILHDLQREVGNRQ